MSTEQPLPQPESPEIRPIFDPEVLKQKYGKLETLKETLDAVKEAKREALRDIEADITKLYPDDTEEHKTKRENEIKAVEKMLERLEKSYLKAAKGSVAESTAENPGLYEFGDLINEYFEELQSITGDTTPDAGAVDLTTVDPYKFWEDTVGWYEKTEGTEEFKEGKIEEEGERWKDAIHNFKEENSNKIKEKENFQAWIETHREDLRRVILRQIDDRKYIIDFTNLSKEFGKSLTDNVRDADFIAKNIGLADLFADISQVVTVWKGDALYTGILNKDFNRKNGLKGGYFYDGKYLDIWHGAIISTNPKDQIYDPDKGEEDLPDSMFEAPKAGEKPREESSFPVVQQAVGDKVVNLIYKSGVDENGEITPVQRKIIEESVKTREKDLNLDEKGTFSLDYKYDEIYGPDTIKKEGKTTFEKKTSDDYSNIDGEIVYRSVEFPNIEIVIPFSKSDCYLLRTKTQKNNTEKPTATVYEFADLEALKVQLGKEVEIQEKSTKKSVDNSEIQILKLNENCSEKTTKSQIKTARKRYPYKHKVKVIVYGSVPTEFVPEETKIQDSELTQEGVDKLPIDEKNKDVKVERGKNISLEDLNILLLKTPGATKLSLKGSNLYEGALFTVASRLNRTLEELNLSYAGFEPSDLQYLDSCTKLKTLDLSYTSITDFEVENYISNLASLKTLNLSNTQITDKSLEELAKLENLTELDLRGTDTSFKATLELKKKLPNCNIKISERAERELNQLIKEKLEEIAKKQEPKLAENINKILGTKDLSIQNTKYDLEKPAINTDIYFEEEKIASAELTMKVTDEKDEKEITLKDLYEDLAKTGDIYDLYKKLKTKDVSGNETKYKGTIGKKVIYIEKIYKFTDKNGKEMKKENVKAIADKLKEKNEQRKQKLENPEPTAEQEITRTFGSSSGITFEKSHSDINNVAQGFLKYKEKVIGQLQIDFTDSDKPKYIYLKYIYDKQGKATDVTKATPEEIKENCKKVDAEIAKKEAEEKANLEEEQEKKNKTERTKELTLALKTINKNLGISEPKTELSSKENKKYLAYPVKYFGEEIGLIEIWLETSLTEHSDKDIWVENSDSTFNGEEGLRTKIETLISAFVEKRKKEKLEEFKKFIAEVQNKKNQNDDSIAYTYELDEENEENIEIKEDTASRPYIEIKVSETIKSTSPTFNAKDSKDIGFISAYLAGESGIYIQNINREDVGGNTPEEKILGISYKLD